MTPAPALTEATMDKMTVEQVELLRTALLTDWANWSEDKDDVQLINTLCDLAKLALSPPQDVADLVEEWRAKLARATGDQNYTLAHKDNISKLLDCVTSLSARNRELEAENVDMKISVIAFAGPFAAEHAKLWGLPKNHLFPTHYDILEKCGARMVDFVRADEAAIRAANLQGNENE